MELKMVLVMLAFTATTSRANPLQTFINNRVICAGLPNGANFCTDDCKQHVQCISGLSVIIQNCDASAEYCYQFNDGSAPFCSSVSQCGGPIQCHQAGKFPDPDDCSKYHICSSPSGTSTVHDCIGTSYNIATDDCDLPVNNPDVCGPEGPVPECTVKGQVGALTQNPAYYFICIQTGNVLYPGLRKCADGYIYNPDDKICKSSISTTTSTTTSVATTTVASTTVSTATTTIPTETTTSSTTAGTTSMLTTTTSGSTTVETTSTDTSSTDTSSTDTSSTDTSSTDTSSTATSTSTSSGTSTSATSTTSVQSTTTDSASTTLPPVDETFDYTVTIAVGTTVAVVVVIGGFVAAILYIRRRKMKMPKSRKLF